MADGAEAPPAGSVGRSDEDLKRARLDVAMERRQAAAAAAAEAAERAAAARLSDYSAPVEPAAAKTPRPSEEQGERGEPALQAAEQPAHWDWADAQDSSAPAPAPAPEAGLRRRAPAPTSKRDRRPEPQRPPRGGAAAIEQPPDSTAAWLVLAFTFLATLGSMHFCEAVGRPEVAPALIFIVALPLILGIFM